MKFCDTSYGFKLVSTKHIPEASGTLYIAEHEKSGASLAYLERDDNNKTFAISFATPPTDDTGVFHIIEHSVLCGSRKFPVKEPFVELLKGSLSTFLNALTYEDRTVYPVSSRCDKDFYNLTDVYLDAVFHPLMLENENVFLQEGWHYEYDEDADALNYNGVVYNEMCGAFASPDEQSGLAIRRALYPDTCYRFESGGHPDAIPSLTYEDFKRAHATYYHPSNAKIFLDGSVDLDEILPLIDSYLSEYEKREIKVDFPLHAPVLSEDIIQKYEASGDECDGRVKITLGYGLGPVFDTIEGDALEILSSVLSATNESPLKKMMVDSGLVTNLSMSVMRTNQHTLYIDMRGVKEENVAAARATLERSIRSIAEACIDKRRIRSTINYVEFKLREHDCGTTPYGVDSALAVFGVWNYGIDPCVALEYESTVAELRRLTESDYFEKLLLRATVDNPHRAAVIMLPDKELADTLAKEKAERARAVRAAMTDEELYATVARAEALDEWQSTPDTPENLDTLPTLTLSDISTEVRHVDTEEYERGGARVLLHDVDCSGITYVNIYLPADMLSPEETYLLSLLLSCFKSMPTEHYTVSELQSEVAENLGQFSFSHTYLRFGKGAPSRLMLTVSASALDTSLDKLVELVGEVLLKTDLSFTDTLKKLLSQARVNREESIASDALGYAISRVAASISAESITSEYLSGFEAYRRTAKYDDDFDSVKDTLPATLASLLKRIAIRDGAIVAVTGKKNSSLANALIDLLPEGKRESSFTHTPLTEKRIGLAIPSRVGYAVMGEIDEEARDIQGIIKVVRGILSYEYLWNAVRVKGGAYDAGFIDNPNGAIVYYSYRDPSPEKSLDAFRGAADFLRETADEGCDLTKFIIGAIGEHDALTTPRTLGIRATKNHLAGRTDEDERALYREMISTSSADLRRAAEILDRISERASVAVAADRARLDATLSDLEEILEI